MMNYLSACVLVVTLALSSGTPPLPPCSETLPAAEFTDCILRKLVATDAELQAANAARALQDERLALRNEAVTVADADRKQLREQLERSSAVQNSVLSSPVFWLGMGLLLGVGATVAVGAVAVNAWKH